MLYCDAKINTYLFCAPAPKTLEIIKVIFVLFCFVFLCCRDNWCQGSWKTLRWGWLPEGPNLSVWPFNLLGGGERLNTELISMGHWCNQSCLCSETSIKTKTDRLQKASQVVRDGSVIKHLLHKCEDRVWTHGTHINARWTWRLPIIQELMRWRQVMPRVSWLATLAESAHSGFKRETLSQ